MVVSFTWVIGLVVALVLAVSYIKSLKGTQAELLKDRRAAYRERDKYEEANETLKVECRRIKKILEAHQLYVPKVGDEVLLQDLGYDELRCEALTVVVEKITDDDDISVVIQQNYFGESGGRILERRWIKLSDIRFTRDKVLGGNQWD